MKISCHLTSLPRWHLTKKFWQFATSNKKKREKITLFNKWDAQEYVPYWKYSANLFDMHNMTWFLMYEYFFFRFRTSDERSLRRVGRRTYHSRFFFCKKKVGDDISTTTCYRIPFHVDVFVNVWLQRIGISYFRFSTPTPHSMFPISGQH